MLCLCRAFKRICPPMMAGKVSWQRQVRVSLHLQRWANQSIFVKAVLSEGFTASAGQRKLWRLLADTRYGLRVEDLCSERREAMSKHRMAKLLAADIASCLSTLSPCNQMCLAMQ